MPTTNLAIPDISVSQAQKEVTANQAHDLLDKAMTGLLAKTVAGVDITLTSAEALQNIFVRLSGAQTADINLIVPTNKKPYIIDNQCTGGFKVTVKTSAGTGIVVLNGERKIIYCDGTNVVAPIKTKRTHAYQVEDLAANVDIGDGTAANARVFFRAPTGLTVTRISILSQGTPAGIDDANTCVIKVYRNGGATPVVSKTYNTATPFPGNNAESDFGTLDATEKILVQGDHLRFDVVNGATANPPAFLLVVEYEVAE